MQLSETASKESVQPLSGEVGSHPDKSIVTVIQQYLQKPWTGYLKVESGAIAWFIYIRQGQLVFITHSIDPFSRLDLYLKDLGDRTPSLSVDVRNELRISLGQADASGPLSPDLQGLAVLLKDHVLEGDAVQTLLTTLSREALESLLLIQSSTYSFVSVKLELDWVRPLTFTKLLADCTERLRVWQSMRSYITSPYQRPYLTQPSEATQTFLASTDHKRLGQLLKGFSFRQLALLQHQDELDIARTLYPLIVDGALEIRAPLTPYHNLPSFINLAPAIDNSSLFPLMEPDEDPVAPPLFQTAASTKTYTIACIDNSAAILETVQEFLKDEILSQKTLSLCLVQDSVKALTELIKVNPDLILLDTELPGVDGYALCQLFRKHPSFKAIPIIMMTGHTGLIDRANASVAGATGFIMKPFTQAELLNVIFKNLGLTH